MLLINSDTFLYTTIYIFYDRFLFKHDLFLGLLHPFLILRIGLNKCNLMFLNITSDYMKFGIKENK